MPRADFSIIAHRRRGVSFALAVAAHVLIVLLLFRLAPRSEPLPTEDAPLTTFNVAPEVEKRTATERPRAAARKAAAAAERPQAAPPPPPRPAQPQADAPPPMLMIPGLFEAADIGKMRGQADAGDAGEADSVAAVGPGEGPGGQKLYNAEWYREPSRAELAGYLGRGAPAGSWALIACRTIADFHVDNCRSLGEAPLGSGLSRAMREASWQFRVRPPRIGGKPLVGAWVRIRFDFSKEPGGTN